MIKHDYYRELVLAILLRRIDNTNNLVGMD